MMYNWQQNDWPEFTFDLQDIDDVLLAFAHETGRVSGILGTMPHDMKMEAIVDTMVAEAIKTSEIEGEFFSRQDVISSIRNNLGLNTKLENVKDKKASGIGKLMVDARESYGEPLTMEKLLEWHSLLMADTKNMEIGKWRTNSEPMQVVSGAYGKEKLHFEAPPSARVPAEMNNFLKWFNSTAPGGYKEIKKAPVRSAVAHLYFESIHPFEDGNGRIGRAIAEKALSQTMGIPMLLSLSRTIEADKKSYYQALEAGQRSNTITNWVNYFVDTILLAQKQALQLVSFVVKKTKFPDRFNTHFNERQLKVILKMFDAGPDGFEGGMRASKYVSIAKTSKATATRDLQQLCDMGAVVRIGGGRNTSYILNLDEDRTYL